MPDPATSAFSRWLRLGRLLPRAVRERVFEPAFADLLYRHLTGKRRRVPFGLQVIATSLACIPVSARWYLFRRSVLLRVSRMAVYSAAALLVVAAIIRLLTQVNGGY